MQNTGAYKKVDDIYPTEVNAVLDAMYPGTDALDAILGEGWIHLQPGDTVDVTLIHVPTNGVLFSKTVTVE